MINSQKMIEKGRKAVESCIAYTSYAEGKGGGKGSHKESHKKGNQEMNIEMIQY